MRLDAIYVLSALWGGNSAPPVCSSASGIPNQVAADVADKSDGVTAFVNINVIPMDNERVLANQTVLVKAGLITAVGPASQVKIPAGATRIDGQGKYLMPGLTDMHAHLNILFTPNDQEFQRRLFSYLAHGVTAVRHLVSDRRYIPVTPPGVIDSGYRPYRTSSTPIPRLYLAAVLPPQQALRPESVAGHLEAARAARYDFLAISASALGRPSEQRVLLDSLVAAARRLRMPLASHDHGASFENILAFGAYGGAIEHLYAFKDLFKRSDNEVSDAELRSRASAVAHACTWITVTLDCTDIRKQPADNLVVGRRIVKALQVAGAGLLLGGDADGGKGLSAIIIHEELEELVRAGLTPYEALRTGTYNVARYWGQLDSSGTVAVGKRADLVLLQGDPLHDIRHAREPIGVMADGSWLDRSMLDEGVLASLKGWLRIEVEGGVMPQITEGQRGIQAHLETFRSLADSLPMVKPQSPQYKQVLQRLATELTGMSVILTPEQHESFDAAVRMWLREQARQGYRVTVTNVDVVR